MKKRSLWSRAGSFMLGKGFYMVLLLCVMAIGGSGYYLYNLAHTALTPATVSAPAHVEVEAPASVPAEQPASETMGPEFGSAQEAASGKDTGTDTSKQASEVKPVQPAKQEEKPAESKEPAAPQEQPTQKPAQPKAPACFAPVEGEAVAAFSATELTYNEAMGDWRTHNGVDLAAQLGEQVCAMQDGDVLTVSNDLLLGTTVTLNHGDGVMSVYANLDPEVDVEQGQRVSAGETIGHVGQTAVGERREGAWLHFAVMKDGETVDPMAYLEGKK